MVVGALLWYNQIPYIMGGWPTNWKIYHRRSPTEVGVLSPTSGSPAWGSGIRRRSPQSIWLWRPAGLEWRSSTGLGETETPLWRVHTRFHVHWDPAQRSDSMGAWAKPTGGFWKVSCGGRGWLWLTAMGLKTLVVAPGNIDWHELSWRSPFWHQDMGLPNSLQVPVLGHLRPNNQLAWNAAPPINRQDA